MLKITASIALVAATVLMLALAAWFVIGSLPVGVIA